MTTVIFIHGISVREPQFSEAFKTIKGELHKELPNLKVVACSWGSSLGAKLNADGASIPLYDSTRNDEQKGLDENIIRWMQLYQDPLYELRLLSLKTPEEQDFIPGQEEPSEKIDEKVKHLNPSDELQAKLKEAGIAEVFTQARQNVVNSTPYQKALGTISDTLTEHRDAIARAIIAESISVCEEQEKYTIIATDAILRDEVVKYLSREILDSERGVGDWLKESLSTLVISQTTDHLKRKRGVISDLTYPLVGDILLYQGRGQKIRALIQSYIEDAEPPVVLLAHSLGGIACVDLLVKEQLDKVKLLVTVGSQAPYFYETNALQSLEFGESLPEYFPQWLNIYDLKDFLSFIGGNIFPNKVQDILVDNQQPFPRSHGAYWTNNATWKAIVGRIKAL
ncbi:hypothetical protein [Floridanema evergladense]|uniref:Alpha/beta hydrolase n=1 Tax=Floridaenema evergladense BLCC-F167 TaxID=3153639 RepID=A0ABV4WK74_9CYAN